MPGEALILSKMLAGPFSMLCFYEHRAFSHYSFIQIQELSLYIQMISYRTWVCQHCSSRISEDFYQCPNCEKGVQDYMQGVSVINSKNSKGKNICPECTYTNPQDASECQMCVYPLKIVEKIKIPQIKCPKCSLQSDASNLECVYCDAELHESKKEQCKICHQKINLNFFDGHYSNCLLSHQILVKQEEQLRQKLRKQNQKALKDMEQCIHCRTKYPPEIMKKHQKECAKEALENLKFDPSTRMTPIQAKAMRYMTLKSEAQHNTVKGQLQKKIKRLGYTIQDLNNLQFYVQNYAPIIIHIHVSYHMQFFIKDTHYRSQFQTNKSSGSLSRTFRVRWEDRMFDKRYSRASDFERVKYGVINFTNDPKGVSACLGYGQSYFLLKEHVRPRCTFTDKDSSIDNSSIATFKYCFKILNKLNDNELKAAIDASKAKEVASNCTTTYKEIQIHGPVQFAKDIQRIYVNRNELKADKKLLDMVYEFSKKFNVQYDFF